MFSDVYIYICSSGINIEIYVYFFTYNTNLELFFEFEPNFYNLNNFNCHKCVPKINYLIDKLLDTPAKKTRPLYNFYSLFF